ncbi:hypothetical protein AUQ41_15155 [Thalassospira sp. MCCC 1A02898]|nr:hypothetical protein AUQ41_15155 [Thalassospira sp. MCCC 1A02898]
MQEFRADKGVMIKTGCNAHPDFLPSFMVSLASFSLCAAITEGAGGVYYIFYATLAFFSSLVCILFYRMFSGRPVFNLIEKCLPMRGICLVFLMAFAVLPDKEPYWGILSVAILPCAAISAFRDVSILSMKLVSLRKKGSS